MMACTCGRELCFYDPATARPFDGTWVTDGEPRKAQEGEYYIDPVHGDVVLWMLRGGSDVELQIVRQLPGKAV